MSPRRRSSGRRTSRKAWVGRFDEPTAAIVEAFTSSLAVDRHLYPYDIAGSLAHVRALVRARLLTPAEGRRLARGLDRVRRELDDGRFRFRASDEDIHMAIERRLTELVGPVGGKLHTGRSRNDQVALDLRLWLRDECARLADAVRALERALVATAERHRTLVLPGYTHLQRAQPVLLAHHLLAHRAMLARDRGRFLDCRKRADELPLGAGALAGAGFAIDRARLARDLGFARPSANSLDAVGDRDAALEFLAACAITAVHVSRLGEELVLWASEEFGFVELPDAFATGSSMMPQKKNPDVAELVRGKSGRVIGALVALLTTLKGLPLAYNRDLQEDKPVLFDAARTVRDSLAVLSAMVPRLRFRAARMAEAADGLLLATDLADALVERGLPFRQAHEVVGGLVRHCLRTGTALRALDAATLARHSPLLTRAMVRRLTPARSLARRRVIGGTAPAEVARALRRARREVER
ncbi:MAG TPA: argininosuccinate lyase [Candidatus Limnocylindria bacterium]|nr:argininosuccinate lyase [Candidatus Limnocylindria bacterium]